MTNESYKCPRCGKELTRYGRADWRCPDHGNMMLELAMIYQVTNPKDKSNE